VSTPGRDDVLWLLDLDLGAGTHRYAQEEVSATSLDAGGTVIYAGGLIVGDLSPDAESASVSVRVHDLVALLRRSDSFRNRRAVLRAYRGEDKLEDAIAIVGLVDSVSMGDPSDPARLDLTIRRASVEASADIVHPDAVISAQTQDDYYENADGTVYPIVIGHPGRQYNDTVSANPAPAVPIMISDTSAPAGTNTRALLAGHPVEAAQVRIWNVSQGSVASVAATVIHEDDNLGRAVAYVDYTLLSSVASDDELMAGFTPRSGWGGGLKHRGRVVEGLGDLLLWGCDTYGLGLYDLPRIETERERLNKYKIDAVINELGVTWDSWVDSMILDQYGVERVNGPRGAYFREIVWTASARNARAYLTTDPDGEGLLVSRAGPQEETQEEPANRITIAYSPILMSASRFRRQCVYAPQSETRPAAGDWQFALHPLCTRSMHLRRSKGNPTGIISRTWPVYTTWDRATAALIATRRVMQHALPHKLVPYTGGRELLDLLAAPYSEVLITDADLALDETPAIVLPGGVISGKRVTLTLRIPPAP
jgi:hypothetical protein